MDIKTLGVVGAGQMGNGIAQVAALSGLEVIMSDIKTEFVEQGLETIKKILQRSVDKAKMTTAEMDAVLGRIKTTVDIKDMVSADFVVEAATENEELKLQLFHQLDGICKQDVILSSNTSSISITRIAGATKRPEKVIGMHFMNPVPVMKLVEIIKGLAERFPGHVAVGMEMFQRPFQEAMDRWSRGELSERGFLRESQWYTNWRMDYRYYKPILDYIRERNIPLLALNASSELEEELRNHGLDGLSEAWRNRLPDMDLSDPHHRELTEAFYNAHPHTSANSFETFYQVQVLWDETMAETVSKYLATEKGSDKKVVVLAGGNHVRYGFGIPRRVFRRLPVAYTIVLPVEVSIPEDKKDRLMDVSLPEIPLVPADFFWMVTYEDLKREKVRMGLMLEEAGGELKVIKVLEESPAAKVGIQPGDILVSLDGQGLQESFDLLYLLDRKTPGDKGKLIIRRDDEPLEITVHFQSSQ